MHPDSQSERLAGNWQQEINHSGGFDTPVVELSTHSIQYSARQYAELLQTREFLVAERYTVADIALYAYTHVAPKGGFPLEPYPAIRAWLERVASQPRHVPITA